MGNLFSKKPSFQLVDQLNHYHIKLLNKEDDKKFGTFKFGVDYLHNGCYLYTTYDYQKIGFDTDFILCQSSSIDKVISNIKLGKETVAYIKWNPHEEKNMCWKDILSNHISCYDIDLVEMHIIDTLSTCKSLRYHNNVKNQHNKYYFKENDIIDGIIYHFIHTPIQQKIILNRLFAITDIHNYIFRLYIQHYYFIS